MKMELVLMSASTFKDTYLSVIYLLSLEVLKIKIIKINISPSIFEDKHLFLLFTYFIFILK